MNRVELELKLNEGRDWVLERFSALTDEQLHRPVTTSEHDPENHWTALDHFAHLALIERNFAAMIRRHFAGGSNPVGLLEDDDGLPRTRDDIMKLVHAMTEEWQHEHHDDDLSEVVALTANARAVTLQLMSELNDAQLDEKLPGAPWADGSVGGVLGANADHGRMHWKWAEETGLLTS
ncbi:MAG TPA: DinB family protein [Acidimicrobiales bacterium]